MVFTANHLTDTDKQNTQTKYNSKNLITHNTAELKLPWFSRFLWHLETRWAYSTTLPSPHGPNKTLVTPGLQRSRTQLLHWLLIWQCVEFKLSVLVFNCMHNLAPSYLSTMCQPVADSAGRRHLCSAACGDLAVPATRTLRYGPRSFAMTGPSTWNSLPAPLRSCHLTSKFRHDLKTELFIRNFQ